MANEVFSPKDFKAWVIEEATPGTAPTFTDDLYQLDVDSVAFPSLSPTQVLSMRTRAGRVFHKDDFFQDNVMRVVEVSLSGTLHKDGGHVLLLQNVAGNAMTPDSLADITIATAQTGISGKYGTEQANATFTLVLAPPDVVGGFNTVLTGCVCTSFEITAEAGSEGGLYKWSATISTGFTPTTNDTTVEAGDTWDSGLISINTLATKKIAGLVSPVMSSFGLTIESPAVYSGFSSNGYEAFGRGEEISVTANATVKYDALTKPLYHTFNTQTAYTQDDWLLLTQGTATNYSISILNGILTDVTFNEGDMMMLDIGLKAVTDGDALLSIDVA